MIQTNYAFSESLGQTPEAPETMGQKPQAHSEPKLGAACSPAEQSPGVTPSEISTVAMSEAGDYDFELEGAEESDNEGIALDDHIAQPRPSGRPMRQEESRSPE